MATRKSKAGSARKQRSHARVVEAAARLYRERGGDGVSVDEVMGEAGLTRGGFYAHFADKNELLAEALGEAFAQSRDSLVGHDPALRGRKWLERAVHVYLSRKHVDAPGDGCAVPALAGEVARGDRKLRKAFTRGLEGVLDGMAEQLGDREQATAALATLIGAVALARATDDEGLREAILQASRAAVLRGR
jgi:TetR/AcrR family transcriptional repressor of nem operon